MTIETAQTKPRVRLSLEKCKRNLVHAGYDAAKTTPDNRRHWANADHLSANAGLVHHVRSTIRSRARYEDANNGYMRGIAKTFVNYVIGKGPRLQMGLTATDDNRFTERKWQLWAKRVRLGRKLRTARRSQVVSGEAFIALVNNPKLKGPIKLDLKLIECDRVASPLGHYSSDPLYVDGIQYDTHGNPVEYTVLKYHPGDLHASARRGLRETQKIRAEHMIHLYDWDRPEQSRGVSEFSSSLPLFALLRRYTLAAVSAAENSASITGVLYSEAGPEDEIDEIDVFDEFNIERNTNLTLPKGHKYQGFKPEQPTTTYPAFKRELLNEIARPLNMPYNLAASNSSEYNYSSGRLDHQSFHNLIRIERDDIEIECLDRILEHWFDEASRVTGFLPQAARAIDAHELHQWFWPGLADVDPVKEAKAQEIRLSNRTMTYSEAYAEQGKDWEQEFEQSAKEQAKLEQLGLSLANASPQPASEGEDQDE